MVNRFAWHREGLDGAQLSTYLINALLDMGACLILQDETLDYICVTNLPSPFKVPAGRTPDDCGIFGEEIGGQLAQARRTVAPGPVPQCLEIQHESGLFFEFRVFCNLANQGQAQYITVIIDRTAEMRGKAAMNALLMEINHRSRNMLAVIQSIANQTERHITDIEVFSRRLRGRIQSLARTQDLVTNSGWKGAQLSDVIAAELDAADSERLHAVRLEGNNIVLSPGSATHVGLAFHELSLLACEAGGAALHKAPSLACQLTTNAFGRRAVIRWQDTLRPDAMGNLDREDLRLVRMILERIVPAALSGSGSLATFEDGTIRYELDFPLD